MGHEGLYTNILNNDKNPNCAICHLPLVIEAELTLTLEQFIEKYSFFNNFIRHLKQVLKCQGPILKNQNESIIYSPGDDSHKYKLSKTLK